ncbi:hypothetical protein V8E36_001398 [Tilletia maclaganii]
MRSLPGDKAIAPPSASLANAYADLDDTSGRVEAFGVIATTSEWTNAPLVSDYRLSLRLYLYGTRTTSSSSLGHLRCPSRRPQRSRANIVARVRTSLLTRGRTRSRSRIGTAAARGPQDQHRSSASAISTAPMPVCMSSLSTVPTFASPSHASAAVIHRDQAD